ncbi:PEPxxWA-CTERM sorting domain-containing protein [Sphingomonas endophytica]|uniref:Ice-binding protein C-terminal domain-containing protein n=1 Tax=Sphingomonas endophytica TaxID=869719 RepID=A0A147I415_9SPHN|nr:PEPxxWA-CTERM sorting domain-containing protein [Sphingomonas endophytica]KTT72830.1 hypothetical protein NS334_08300 [Sphingomonas endophytica]
MIRFVAGVMLAGAALPAQAAVTIGTQIVDARLQGVIAGQALDRSGSDAGNMTGRVSADVRSNQAASPSNGGVAMQGIASVVATLADAAHCRVTFRRTLAITAPGSDDSLLTGSSTYRYFFTVDTATAFDLNWGVSGYGASADGLVPAQTVSLTERDTGVSLLRLDGLGDGADGTTQVTLAAGRYTLSVEDAHAPVSRPGSGSGLSSAYSFAMRAVPEPSSWALMLVGFGTVGVGLRRARRRVTLAVR